MFLARWAFGALHRLRSLQGRGPLARPERMLRITELTRPDHAQLRYQCESDGCGSLFPRLAQPSTQGPYALGK